MLRMTDIAAKAGVSQTTVSFVLSGRETSVRISDGTRQRVLAVAEELGYRSNHLARAMRTGNTHMLGFIGGDLCSENVGRMLDGALEEAEKSGFTLKILPHRDNENIRENIIRRSSELRLTGVAALHLPTEMLELLRAETQQCGYGMVLLDSPMPLDGVPQVMSDDENGVRLAISHLVELGHRRIAMIAGNNPSTITTARERTFRRVMSDAQLELPAGYVAYGDYRLREPSVAAAKALLQLPAAQRPTGIFCTGDLVACVVVQVAQELGLSVPRDVSVIGFGDFRVAGFLVPGLTTIRQPFREMGKRAVQRLIVQAESQGNGSHTGNGKAHLAKTQQRDFDVGKNGAQAQKEGGNTELLPVSLIIRDSTASPH